jgi:hypothetical protein
MLNSRSLCFPEKPIGKLMGSSEPEKVLTGIGLTRIGLTRIGSQTLHSQFAIAAPTPAQIAEAQTIARECVAKNYRGC